MTDVRSFLGVANYCKLSCPGLSRVLSPLSELLGSECPDFSWSDVCQRSFDVVTKALLEIVQESDFTQQRVNRSVDCLHNFDDRDVKTQQQQQQQQQQEQQQKQKHIESLQ